MLLDDSLGASGARILCTLAPCLERRESVGALRGLHRRRARAYSRAGEYEVRGMIELVDAADGVSAVADSSTAMISGWRSFPRPTDFYGFAGLYPSGYVARPGPLGILAVRIRAAGTETPASAGRRASPTISRRIPMSSCTPEMACSV